MPDVDQLFAQSMIAARKRRGLSQYALATAMNKQGFSWRQSTVYSIESGGRRVQLGEAVAVARLLEVELVDLLDSAGAESRFALVDAIKAYLSAAGRELSRTAGAAGNARAMLADLVERLASAGVESIPLGDDVIVGTAAEEFWVERYRDYRLSQLMAYATELLDEDLGGTFGDEVKFTENNF